MKILFLSNSLERTGAPLVLLNFLKWIKANQSETIIHLISLEGGVLKIDFEKYCDNIVIYKKNIFEKISNKINLLKKNESTFFLNKIVFQKNIYFDIIFANTIVTLPLLMFFNHNKKKCKSILHIHELEYAIQFHLPNIKDYLININQIIAVSVKVKNNLILNHNIQQEKISVIYPPVAINRLNSIPRDKKNFLVGGAGQVRWEKGADLFIQVAYLVKNKYPDYNIKFIWVGKISKIEKIKINYEINKLDLEGYLTFVGEKENIHSYINDFGVFVLTSREDPFPLVCIEAGLLEKPIICFEGASGTQEILQFGGGFIVPYLDVEAMAEKIIYYYNNRDLQIKDGQRSKELFSQFTPENQYSKNFEIISKVLNLP